MVAPLRLRGSETSGPNSQNPNVNAGVSVYAIQEMSESEVLDGISYRLLREFAKVDLVTPKTGDLTLRDTIGDTPTISTGDYVDTTRNLDVGGKGSFNELNMIRSNTTSIYQVLTAVTGAIVRPLCYENLALREMTNAEIAETILTPTMNRMTNRGVGSYHFSSTTPKDPISGSDLPGVWVSVFTLNDRFKIGVVPRTSAAGFVNNTVQPPTGSTVSFSIPQQSTDVTTVYHLWRKTDDNAPPQSQPRPLKWANTAERGKHIVEMTNAEILTLLIQFRNLIVTDGRGSYKFQDGAPQGGSWSRRGEAIQDLLNAVTASTFATATITNSTNVFNQVQTFNRNIQTVFTGSFTRSRTQFFADNMFDSDSTATFSRQVAKDFTGTFVRRILRDVPIVKFFNNVAVTTSRAELVDSIVVLQNNDYLWVKRTN